MYMKIKGKQSQLHIRGNLVVWDNSVCLQEMGYLFTLQSSNVHCAQRCQLQENKNPQSDGQKSPEIPRSQFQGKTR